MKKMFLTTIIWLMLWPQFVLAELPSAILITEVRLGSPESAKAEYVELKNTTNLWIELEGYQLQYLSASGTSWQAKVEFAGSLAPFDSLLVSTVEAELTSDFIATLGLSGTGGHVRVVKVDGENETELDKFGWGTASQPETSALAEFDATKVLKRINNEDGDHLDTNDNSLDFFVSESPTPKPSSVIKEEAVCTEDPVVDPVDPGTPVIDPLPETLPATTPIVKTYAKLKLTELLVDPVSPATDKQDEFIEIYNPNSFSVDLAGYVLESGAEFTYDYVLPSYTLKAGEYLAVFSLDSKLTLSNSGGAARILDPNLAEIDRTWSYEKAKAGQSWALTTSKTWVWSSTPTAHLPNSFAVADTENSDNGVLTKRVAVAGISSTSGGSSASSNASSTNEYVEPESRTDSELDNSVLATVAALAILYGLYEYRADIKFRFNQLRGFAKDRLPNWEKPAWWGSPRTFWRRWRRQDSLN